MTQTMHSFFGFEDGRSAGVQFPECFFSVSESKSVTDLDTLTRGDTLLKIQGPRMLIGREARHGLVATL